MLQFETVSYNSAKMNMTYPACSNNMEVLKPTDFQPLVKPEDLMDFTLNVFTLVNHFYGLNAGERLGVGRSGSKRPGS